MKDRSLVKYLIWAFALAWPIQALASHFALQGKASVFQGLMVLCMLAPTAAALLAGISLRDMGWKPELRRNWRWLLAAWLVPAALTVLGAALYFLIFPGQLDLSGELYRVQLVGAVGEEAAAEAIAQLEAQGLSLRLLLPIQALQALTYAPLINTFPSLGEELGWRGAMMPRLKARFGKTGGRLLGGVIWGAWHWPVMILAGYEYGLRYWGAPVLGPIVFCLFATALGILLDICYEKTGSIWAPALGHGAVNAAAGLPLLCLDPAYADRMILGPCMQGLIAGIPLLALALVALLRDRGEQAQAPAPGEAA